MTLITIREHSGSTDDSNATVCFDQGTPYPIKIHDPFSKGKEAQLEWYFEQHMRFPFVKQAEAQSAVHNVQVYGEELFQQVFAHPEALATYQSLVSDGPAGLEIAVEGSAHFHMLHWEALKDPQQARAFALDHPLVRRQGAPPVMRAGLRPSPTFNVLVVTARPFGGRETGFRTIARPLLQEVQQSGVPVQIDMVRPGSYRALVEHLQETAAWSGDGYYHAVHLDIHGAIVSFDQLQIGLQTSQYVAGSRYYREGYEGTKAFFFLEGNCDGQSDPVEAAELAELFAKHHLPIVVLNACQSSKQSSASEADLGSRLMEAGVPLVLAMGYSLSVSAAQHLFRVLYEQMCQGEAFSVAVQRARHALWQHKQRRGYFQQTVALDDWLLPVVYQNQEQRLDKLALTPDEQAILDERYQHTFPFPQPRYGFVGREFDTLELEKRLLWRHNVVLVQGMGGVGKTTLLHSAGAWWQMTGLVEQVFYFSFADRAWTYEQMMDVMAQQLFQTSATPSHDNYYERVFQPMSLAARHAMLTRRLRSQRHLLIIDSLEMVTGSHLAMQPMIPASQQGMLRYFLQSLEGGQTFVLLGSRGDGEWLTSSSTQHNGEPARPMGEDEHALPIDAGLSQYAVYALGGLDTEATSVLVDNILEQHQAAHYQDKSFRDELRNVLSLLNGSPLALEVLVAQLAHCSPEALVGQLWGAQQRSSHGRSYPYHCASEDIDTVSKHVLHAVEYAASVTSPELRGLLLCFAPFTSVIKQDVLESYINVLRQEPALHNIPFERWRLVLRELIYVELLALHAEEEDYLCVCPTLTYLLGLRWQQVCQQSAPVGTEEHPDERDSTAATCQAINRAFLTLYQEFGGKIAGRIHAPDEVERERGHMLVELEYQNMVTALNLALQSKVSIQDLYFAISSYLDASDDQHGVRELCESVLRQLDTYPPEALKGPIGAEFVGILDDIAKRQFAAKEYTRAETSYVRMLELIDGLEHINRSQPSKMTASAYYQLGFVAHEQGLRLQAEEYYDQALQIFADLGDLHEQARMHYHLGLLAQEGQRWEVAEERYQQAVRLFTELSNRSEQARALYHLGWVLREQRKWEPAEEAYQQALKLFVKASDAQSQADIYSQLGVVARAGRQWQKAKDYYQQALQRYQELDNQSNQARMCQQLGMVAQTQRQWEQAESYYQQALRIFFALDDRYAQADIYQNLGKVAQQQKQWEAVESYYQQALQIYGDLNDMYEQAAMYEQLGRVAQKQRLWPQAEFCTSKALQMYGDLNDIHRQANMYSQLGILARAQRQWDQSREHFLHALKLYVTQSDTHSASITLGDLAWQWRESSDDQLPMAIASVLGLPEDDVRERLRKSR